ncbi:hypothetical protein IAT38_007002 [Cryptococcus sp. DSM 104549]
MTAPYSDIYPNTEDRLLPVKNRTEPFWLCERDLELQHARTTADLPSSADVVVVGSGLTGAMMAYRLYTEADAAGKKINVVLLEADEVCSGATARNGGHCKPVSFVGHRANVKAHGREVADHLINFEMAALGLYADIVQKEDIDCDMHVTRAFDVCFNDKDVVEVKKDFDARRADFLDKMREQDVRAVEDPRDLEALTGIKGGKWGASYPAGHLWPYKLATGLLRIALRKGLNLQSHTPALSLSPSSTMGLWDVATSRGTITTSSLIVATNAYTSGFLPEFKDLVIPVRGTACSITPPPASHAHGSLPGPIKYTYGIRHGNGDVDYMIPRQGRGRIPGVGDKSIIFGGAKSGFLGDVPQWYDNKRDDELMPGAVEYFQGFMGKHFSGWRGNEMGNVDRVWSGVLGYSSDFLPYVGEVPDKPGVFVIAGFTGHGMPRIPGCTAALTALAISRLTTGTTSPAAQQAFEQALPKPYWLTKERYESRVNVIKEKMAPADFGRAIEKDADGGIVEKLGSAKL